jgi:hypothetical protein
MTINVTFKFHDSVYERYNNREPVKPREKDAVDECLDQIQTCPTDKEIIDGAKECYDQVKECPTDEWCKIL